MAGYELPDDPEALRAVTTTDFMTAESAEIPWEVIGKTTSRIVNEVKHVKDSYGGNKNE